MPAGEHTRSRLEMGDRATGSRTAPHSPSESTADRRPATCAVRRLYWAHPPKRISRDLLELAVAWKLQEKVLGGLGPAIKRQLSTLAQTMETTGDLAKSRAMKLRPGAKLVREWHGETHDVLVLDDGFRWRGQHWRSLSVIAREITGTQWSGPRFFGLLIGKGPEPMRAAAGETLDLLEATNA